MTISTESWYRHPSFRTELAELLAHPTMQTALAIVEKQGLKPTLMTSGVDLIHFFALMGAKRDGFFESLKNLESLSKPQPPPAPAAQPWSSKPPGADDDRTTAP